MADMFCFMEYATTILVGRSNQGFGEITTCRPWGVMSEKPQLPKRSLLKEVITAYIGVHSSNAKTHSLRTGNGDYSKNLALILKGMWT